MYAASKLALEHNIISRPVLFSLNDAVFGGGMAQRRRFREKGIAGEPLLLVVAIRAELVAIR